MDTLPSQATSESADRIFHVHRRGAAQVRHLLLSIILTLSIAPCSSSGQALVDVLGGGPDGAAGYRVASASERQQVKVMRGARRLESSPALALKAGDEIETGATTSVLIRYPEGHELLIMHNTHVRLGSIFVFFGELFVRAKGRFRVETVFMTAGVEGTEFLVRADRRDDSVEVVVAEGAVLCQPKSRRWEPVRVAAAQQLTVQSLSGTESEALGPPSSQSSSKAPPPTQQADRHLIYRGIGDSLVEKLPASGSDLARIDLVIRGLNQLMNQ